jgi:hypothetical protein
MPAPRNRRHLLVRAAPRRLLSASCRSTVSKACCSAWRSATRSETRPKGSFRAAVVTSATTSRTDMLAVVRLVSRPDVGAGFKPALHPLDPGTPAGARSDRPGTVARDVRESPHLWPRAYCGRGMYRASAPQIRTAVSGACVDECLSAISK